MVKLRGSQDLRSPSLIMAPDANHRLSHKFAKHHTKHEKTHLMNGLSIITSSNNYFL